MKTKKFKRIISALLIVLSINCNLKVQAMNDPVYEQMDSHPHVQHTGYSSVDNIPDRLDTPWYRKTVSIKTLLLTCMVTTAITLGCTLGPLRAQVSDLEQDNTYLSCCANMNYHAVARLCPVNVSGLVGGNCTPSPETRHVIWCDPNIAPIKPGHANKCSVLKFKP